MMRGIRSDGAAYQEFLQLKRSLSRSSLLLKKLLIYNLLEPFSLIRFKDCIKTGDGIRAKKSDETLEEDLFDWSGRRPGRIY